MGDGSDPASELVTAAHPEGTGLPAAAGASTKPLREIAQPYVAEGPSGVNVRDRLKGLTGEDVAVLRAVGMHMGRLASRDLALRCRDGLEYSSETWAERKRELTPECSSRWAGSVTGRTHHQWALACRAQLRDLQGKRDTADLIRYRLSLPLGTKGSGGKPGGYRSKQEWFAKSRRLAALETAICRIEADRAAGRVAVVRGGHRMLNQRHHLDAAGKTEEQWREDWEARRWFLQADGESGSLFGNQTIRVTPDGEVSVRLPKPLEYLANSGQGRYVLSARVSFPYRGEEWRDRVTANQAVAYRIHLDVQRDRWYIDASWTRKAMPAVPLDALRDGGVIGVDTNADHLAAWRLDRHGNPIGAPRRFDYDLSGSAQHRDAQVRHALTQMLHWAQDSGAQAIAVEELDFTDSRTREKHGRNKRIRQVISGMPTAKLRARLVSMCAEAGIGIIAVDPAYTSKWGAQHWQKPLSTPKRPATRHEAASVAIGRRALGHRIRRREAPPRQHQRDAAGHRTAQARPSDCGREGNRPRAPGPRTRSAGTGRSRNAADQNAQDRSGHSAAQSMHSLQQRLTPSGATFTLSELDQSI